MAAALTHNMAGPGAVSPSMAPAKQRRKSQPLPNPPNKLVQIEQDIYERIVRLYDQGLLVERIDHIPIEMRPKTYPRPTRCCIYRDRAMIRYRILACLGFRVEEEDETRTLASYAKEVLERPFTVTPQKPVLTVISEACNHCTKQQYLVTDACQNCVAQPCAHNCPKKCISHPHDRAVIDSDACVRCGKCVQVCPYHAIIDIPIPCIKACPVGAITHNPDGSKVFDWNKCVQCGGCQRSCPFGAVMQRSMMITVLRHLSDKNKKVIALLAPAVAGDFGAASLEAIVSSVKELGFHDVLEVSLGADQTAIAEAHEFVERMENFAQGKPKAMPFMTTSCCPAHMACIKKHIPEIEDAVSETPTPMHFTAVMAKQMYPDCITVFIGPCTAKLSESIDDPAVDYAMSFMETVAWLRARGLELTDPETPITLKGKSEGRGFPLIGGVAAAVANFAKPSEHVPAVKPVIIDGLNPAAVKRLRSFAKKAPPGNLVEVMACEGGCVAGPGTTVPPAIATARARMCANKSAHHADAKETIVKPVIIRGDRVIEPN